MTAIWQRLLRREQSLIRQDRNLIMVLLVAPVFYAFFYGSIYLHKSGQDIAVVVVDQDHTPWSREFIRSLDAHPLIRVQEVATEVSAARKPLDALSACGVIVIPPGAYRRLCRQEAATVVVEINASRFLVANDINKAVNEVAEETGRRFAENALSRAGRPQTMATPLAADLRTLANLTGSYGDFMLPGLLMLILQQTLLIGLAEGIGQERQSGTLAEWLTEADHRPWLAVMGKGTFYVLLYGGYAALFLTLHYSVFKLIQAGPWGSVVMLLAMFLICATSWAMLIGTFFSGKLQALQWSVFTSYPVFLLSGYSWPLQAMPHSLQVLAQLLPLTPFLQAFGRVTLLGADWTQIMPELLHLVLLTALCFWAAGRRLAALSQSRLSPDRQE